MWAIYHQPGGATIIQHEDEILPSGFNFVREATEGEIEDEQQRRIARSTHLLKRAWHSVWPLAVMLLALIPCKAPEGEIGSLIFLGVGIVGIVLDRWEKYTPE